MGASVPFEIGSEADVDVDHFVSNGLHSGSGHTQTDTENRNQPAACTGLEEGEELLDL